VSVTALTILVTLGRVLYERRRFGRRAALDGPAAAFLLLGAYFSCFHFIFYDSLLATVPTVLLFTDPGRYANLPRSWRALPGWLWRQAPLLLLAFTMLGTYVMNLIWLNGHGPPIDTYAALALWAWCGVEWLRRSEPPWCVLGEEPADPASVAPLHPLPDGAHVPPHIHDQPQEREYNQQQDQPDAHREQRLEQGLDELQLPASHELPEGRL
jgi:hypothetical protein